MKTITKFIYAAFAVFALACFAFSPAARAVSPAPDGGYANYNTAEGTNALLHLTSGIYNTALGGQALYSTTFGSYNTAVGLNALYLNTGGYNTANGAFALLRNTTGTQNTATGVNALISNTTGGYNTANGVNTLYRNTTGFRNTATGVQALFNNTTGGYNTANGVNTLYRNTTGDENTASGHNALYSNTEGFENTATGHNALFGNTEGFDNTADGGNALAGNTTGGGNTGIGWQALLNNFAGSNNVAVGFNAGLHNTGSNNIALGMDAGVELTTGDFNIDIGNQGVATESNTIRIGDSNQTATYIAGISGQTASGAVAVYVNTDGKLGTLTSSARFKTQIKPMDKSSEAILALKPVTFRYKREIDPARSPQFGLVAEDVEKVNPDLVARDAEGKVNTVRYEAVNAMLLNEFLKEHRTVQEQQKEIDALRAELKEQRSLIQKVSDKVELDKPAPQTVANNLR